MIALADAARVWWEFVASGLLDSAVLFAVAWVLWWPWRRRAPAQLGYGLFLLVLLDLALPLEVRLPVEWAQFFPGYQLARLGGVQAEGAVAAGDVPAAVTGPPVPAASDPTPWLFAAWLAGVAGFALCWLVRQRRTRRVLAGARPVGPSDVSVDFPALCRAMGLRRTVPLRVVADLASPAAAGLLRPCILVPEGLLAGLPPDQQRWILLHELAHVRRGDLWVVLFQRCVQIAFFFHPLVWWANRIIDEQREFACDDAALAAFDGGRKACGAGFLSVVEWAQGRACARAGTLGMVSSHHLIRRRLMRILDGRRRTGGRAATTSTVMVLALGAFLLPTVRAQDPAEKDTEQLRLEILRHRIERWQAEGELLKRELEALQRRRGTPAGRAAAKGRADEARPYPPHPGPDRPFHAVPDTASCIQCHTNLPPFLPGVRCPALPHPPAGPSRPAPDPADRRRSDVPAPAGRSFPVPDSYGGRMPAPFPPRAPRTSPPRPPASRDSTSTAAPPPTTPEK